MSLASDCYLNEADWSFVKKLTRIAHVHVLSSQVSIMLYEHFNIGSNKDRPLIFPSNWSLQHVYTRPTTNGDNRAVFMIFEILKK